MQGIFCDPDVMRYTDNGVQTPEFASLWIARMLCCYLVWGFGMWAIVEKATSEVIGYAGLSRYSDRCEPNEAELGFRLARAHWGRGYATEAARAVCVECCWIESLPSSIQKIWPRYESSRRSA
jgi:RimJ/RimL family protein N-acetyltransferase